MTGPESPRSRSNGCRAALSHHPQQTHTRGRDCARPIPPTPLRMHLNSSRLFLRHQNEGAGPVSQCLGAQRWAEPACDRVSHFSRQARASDALGSFAVRTGWEVVCAACVRAPLSPPEGSSQPPELRPGRKWKVAPATARVSRHVPSAHVQHSEIAMRATVPNAPRSAKQ